MGRQWRRVEIAHVQKPSVHHITINGNAEPEIATLLCDGCSDPIPDGLPAVAISAWENGELGAWEQKYSQKAAQ
jgi:hypothetical protein